MADNSGGEKTLPASQQKKRKAREDGNVAKSQDLNSAFTLAMALLGMVVFGGFMFDVLLDAEIYYLGNAHEMDLEEVTIQVLAARSMYHIGLCTLPIALVMLVAGVSMNLLQVGFLFTLKPMQPKLDKINPISGMKKFVSMRSLVELIKSLSKLAIVGVIVYLTLKSRVDEIILFMGLSPAALVPAVGSLVVSVWWRIALAMIVLGILDYGYQYWQREQDLKMTQQEAKQEMKELEGDPHIKRKVRQLQRQIAMQRMMADVPEADVIITNPTHYAVALRYDPSTMGSPTVVAKGARIIAARIREIGVEHQVPIVQKPELARTLYRTVEIGKPIPESLFRTVAEVLSFVYQIDRRAEKIRERRNIVTEMQQAV